MKRPMPADESTLTWTQHSAVVLGEIKEAWRILRAMVDRASSTVSWYEEIDHQPPHGHGDPADVWAAAEMVYLARQLLHSGPSSR